MLTLGIGVNAGIFGLINGLLLRPLPGAAAEGALVGLYSHDRTTERGYRAFSYPGFIDIREADGPFLQLTAHNMAMVGVNEGNATRQSFVDVVGTGYFETLGVRPPMGHGLPPTKSARAANYGRLSSATSIGSAPAAPRYSWRPSSSCRLGVHEQAACRSCGNCWCKGCCCR